MLYLNEDLKMARVARTRSKCMCSNYMVGAVLKTKNGNRYCGCNIDNDGIQSICAERVAFGNAIAEGETEFERIVIVGAPKEADEFEKCLPCGYCRQFMGQFVDKDFKIYTQYADKIAEYTIDELLPDAFHLKK